MSMVTLYEVGGCVRDRLLGVSSKDIDYAVEADSFTAMREFLSVHRMEIFLEKPEFLTIRARFPKHVPDRLRAVVPDTEDLGRLTADFVLCRADGDYTDGRRPDIVTPGTIFDDLARRDFTVNAIARRSDGTLLDPHRGVEDLQLRQLAAVGDPEARIREDSLRALRAVRFVVTKGFTLAPDLQAALSSSWLPPLLSAVSEERRREELHKAFAVDTFGTLKLLGDLGDDFFAAALGDGLWLKPTNETRPR